MSTLSRAACALLVGLFAAGPAEANAPALWLSPTDDVTQRGVDFQLLFDDPPSWPAAAKRVAVFGVPVIISCERRPRPSNASSRGFDRAGSASPWESTHFPLTSTSVATASKA